MRAGTQSIVRAAGGTLALTLLLNGAPPVLGMSLEAQGGATIEPTVTPRDTLTLVALQRLAVERDPRALQAALETQRRDLEVGNVLANRLPQLELRTDAGYQSEVTAIPIAQPGVEVGRPPNDRYEAAFGVQWTVWDGGRSGARSGLEDSRHEGALSALEATLYQARLDVSASFFEALLLQDALDETATLIEDLEARLVDVRARVEAGAALPGDTALLRAEVLRAQQQRAAIYADRLAALDVLSLLTGVELGQETSFAPPELSHLVEPLRTLGPHGGALPASLRVHPQFQLFDAQHRGVDRELQLQRTGRMPVLQAFGDLAYGSPGYEQFTTELHDYWRAGVRLQWTPWDWGQRDRDAEVLRIRQTILRSEEQAFEERLLRALQRPLRAISRLEEALETDAAIIALREQVERQARAQFAERAIPASVYTDARTNLTEARIDQARHRTQRARAQAEALMTLGLELR